MNADELELPSVDGLGMQQLKLQLCTVSYGSPEFTVLTRLLSVG